MPALTEPTSLNLPPAICFRVTRNCNARCSFCLAPPDGVEADYHTLRFRIDWLLDHGVRRIHFCGGEPTIHPSFPRLLAYANACGARTSLCSNAISIPGALLPLLKITGTPVRVSLHGDRARHDAIAGAGCFDLAAGNLRRLMAAGIATSLQTTIVARGVDAVDWAVQFCIGQGVRRLGIVPFIPRGKGGGRRSEFALSEQERRALRSLVARQRRALAGRLELRWLDFTAGYIPVVEPDGSVVMEGATESMDRTICRIGERI